MLSDLRHRWFIWRNFTVHWWNKGYRRKRRPMLRDARHRWFIWRNYTDHWWDRRQR